MAKKQEKKPVSFDDIIRSGRQKKQNEQLANQILGKGRRERRASAPSAGIQKPQAARPGSLASRITVPKRSASTANLRPNKPNPASVAIPTGPRSMKNGNRNRVANPQRIQNAIQSGSSQMTVHAPKKSGLSIKGASGPFIVIGSNFAPGTTAADIESALEATCGPMISCRVISHNPTVTAEIAFENKFSAQNLVANFHNQRADGRLLSMTLQPDGTPLSTTHNPYNDLRAKADRERQKRRADPDVQNGNYGFGNNGSPRSHKSSSGLYSDEMMMDDAPVSRNNQSRRYH
ncbi:hypothetical protein N7456_001786 [Penicillium angulare]|uniref:RRM domain-containing protein n=1 Tax=Penicillium angulare TaxID=116970 RepID=A0A9W9KPM3_9EURO|nr:hypothetical protein N7456_001786 [Penicillium angulare]